ncbi:MULTISPECIES: type 1 glutamine amidotransferase family protein [Streptococcus]|jgi:intracellular protease, thiJ/pfpI family|uniref:Glutamine amidotransferase n=1 Tax=Streptococcus sanguinis TaxID=1305 RepID=A0A3P1S9H6_STRSA|nr:MULTISPECIES: type 1 glutamine amidotransferase family protein [Streptococcus]MBF1721363.1 glutamine amidotransferase [Streptococcus sp.]RRC93883.1 glutamine amidotransferase [Streptococcus sanguinis]RSI38971.1 putative protease YdeA [Streptococcus sanguinis]WNU94455.1 type 1 glutamine amidotransferase family protein [Streptococcus sp. DTU_2020_1000888_1_SI_GRL_NUU_041A]
MKNIVYLYVFDTMADWEIGYLMPEINLGRYYKKGVLPLKVVTVGITKTPITTMGGLKILPEIELNECSIDDVAALILPGGNTWTETIHTPIIRMAEKYLDKGIVVGAICGATIGLAGGGILDQRAHTSNELGYLKMFCPSYDGEKYYKQECVVTDGNLITASGTAPLQFAFHVLKILDVFLLDTLNSWYNLYKTQESKYFFDLMNSIQ